MLQDGSAVLGGGVFFDSFSSAAAAAEPGVVTTGLRVYPNPASAWLTVETQDEPVLGLRLSDMSGRVIEDVQFFRQFPVREYRLSLATLLPGVYVLSVRTDKGWASEKVVKN